MNEQMIQALVNLMRTMPCEVTHKVRKNPKGIHIIIDVTQEEMDFIVNQMRTK